MLESKEQRTEEQIQELIDQAYKRGYKAGQENALTVDSDKLIEQGRNMAWNAVCKILRMSEKEYSSLFNTDCTNSYYRIGKLLSMSVSEAIKLVGEYEQKNQNEQEEIHVGDEVYLCDSTAPRVVTCIFDTYGVAIAVQITESGRWAVDNIRNLHKTGRHFSEIENVLKKLGESK